MTLEEPFSSASAPLPCLRHALDRFQTTTKPSTGGKFDLPSPGLRVESIQDPLAFPLSRIQACELIRPATVSKRTHGVRIALNPSTHGCWQVAHSFLQFTNPAWKHAETRLVQHVAKELGLPPLHVEASLYCMMIYSPGATFKPHVTRTDRTVFGTLSIQLPSSFRGGEHKIIHAKQSTVYHRGVNDGSAEYSSYYTAFYDDVKHEISPIKEGFRASLLYDLHWKGGGHLPTASRPSLDPVVEALSQHSKRFPFGAWTLALSLQHMYDTSQLQKEGVNALKGSDKQELLAIERASQVAGLGAVDFLICSLRRTDYDSTHLDWEEYSDCGDYEQGEVELHGMYGSKDEWIRNEVTDFPWEDAQIVLKRQHSYYVGRAKELTFGRDAIIIWPKGKLLQLRTLCSEDIEEVLDRTSRASLMSSVDRLLDCKEALGVARWRVWEDTKTLVAIATKNKLLAQAVRALNFASQIPNAGDVGNIFCDAVSVFGWENIEQVSEKLLSPNDTNIGYDEDRIHLVDQLLSRDLISSAGALRATNYLVEGLNKRKSLSTRPTLNGAINSPSRSQARRKLHVQLWSKLFGLFSKLHAICSNDEKVLKYLENLDGLYKRFLDIIKYLNDDDFGIVAEVFHTSRVVEESALVAPGARLALSNRRKELLINRFVKQTKSLLSLTPPFKTMDSASMWSPFLRLMNRVVRSNPYDLSVKQTFLQFLQKVSTSAITAQHDALVTAVVLYDEGRPSDSHVLKKIKEYALIARMPPEERSVRLEVKSLEDATREVPPKMQVSYLGPHGTGYAEIEEFMGSERMQFDWTRMMDSSEKAKEVVKKITKMLPGCMKLEDKTVGKYASLSLSKPFDKERLVWIKYHVDLVKLREARDKLAELLARSKRPNGNSAEESSAKRAKTSAQEASRRTTISTVNH